MISVLIFYIADTFCSGAFWRRAEKKEHPYANFPHTAVFSQVYSALCWMLVVFVIVLYNMRMSLRG